jgi:hypothetical protein
MFDLTTEREDFSGELRIGVRRTISDERSEVGWPVQAQPTSLLALYAPRPSLRSLWSNIPSNNARAYGRRRDLWRGGRVMPTGLYGSPQLGPFRESPQRQSSVRRVAAVLTLEPIWRRLIPWNRLRAPFRVATLVAWIAVVLLVGPLLSARVSSANLPERVRSALHLDPTPTFTPQQRDYVAALATQERQGHTPEATQVVGVRVGAADVALVSSTCSSTGLPPITTCKGSLRNVSGRNLAGLQVTLGWSATQGGEPQLTASASIDLDPLLPDQTSSWTVINRYNEALRWYRATVTDSSGADVRVRDDRAVTP